MGDNKMIKDKVLKMNDGKSYYVLDSIDYDNRLFVLALECDLDNDKVNEDDYYAMEVVMKNGELIIEQILDDNLANMVVDMLINKVRNN